MLASSPCQRPSAETSQAGHAYTLTSFGTCQGQAKARQGPYPHTRGELLGQAPLLAEVVPRCWSFRPCPNSIPPWPAWPGWFSHLFSLCPGPGAQSGQCLEPGLSPAHLCVCVYVCDATSLPVPCQGPRIHTACAHMLGLGHGPQSSCLRWALCKHFCACWVGVYLRGLASSLGGLRVPAGQGLALGFRHTITTQACVHACLVCSSHTHPSPRSCRTPPPTTHTSHAVHPEAAHVSHTRCRCRYTSASHMLPFSHPPRDTRRLLPDPFPVPRPRGALPSGACEYAMGVPGCTMASVCAVACPFLGLANAPVWGLLCEACVLTLS
jgi:hypothetical protein